ncbi:hypothetical protein QVD17_10407 [Tagetes erecta]|uniref:EF-hand domain-containing protein n=1 Tax=Tagetes erecta TaxID=13708 RepID=A0AAD8L694_TARER|nr:hypothetical protein QVD17_10407 [Tagetes erecta]
MRKAWVVRQVEVPLTEEQLKGLIKRFDTDGDGKISRKELKAGLRNLGLRFAGFRAMRALRHADANGDGVITDDEMNELAKYVSKWEVVNVGMELNSRVANTAASLVMATKVENMGKGHDSRERVKEEI